MKNLKNIKINLGNFEVAEIKEILWELCYNKENAMEELDIKVDNPKDLIKLILEECKNSGKELNFAGEKPYLDTYGIDIGISNPVVRDIILEHCYVAFEKEVSLQNSPERAIEKIIKLLKTQDSNENYEKRVFGGLRALGFNYEEAQYLKATCNLYPVGLLLEKMVIANPPEKIFDDDLEVAFEDAFNNSDNPEQSQEDSNIIKIADLLENRAGKAVLLTVILQNQNEIETIYERFDMIGDIASINGLEEKIVAKQKEIESLQEEMNKISEVIKVANTLEERGITFEYVVNNAGKIFDLFDAVARL